MRFVLTVAALSVALAASAQDKVPTPAPGNYYLWYGPNSSTKLRLGVVSFDANGAVKLVAAAPNTPVKLGKPTAVDGRLNLPVMLGSNDLSFQAGPGTDGKGVVGSFGNADIVLRGGLEPTDKTEIAQDESSVREEPLPAVAEAVKASAKVRTMRQQALREQDAAAKDKIVKEADELEKKSEATATEALRSVVKAGGKGAAAAAEALVSQADKLPPAEVATYAKLVGDDAKRYGPRFETVAATRLATTLADGGPTDLAIEYARKAADMPGLSAKNRSAALKILAGIQTKAGKADAATATKQEIAKLESVIDAEYKQSVPPFKPEPYAGRKDKSADRVPVMELFTGAQCPPCVAADVAFDALTKSYPEHDVVLLQYHLHIPGPDPLTNPDAVARFEYYGKLNEQAFGGTPSVAFDGKPAAGGGGGMGASKPKYAQFTDQLDKRLEEKATVTIAGSAKRAGDQLTGTVEVTVKEPKDLVKLRLVLTEAEIKYVGGNGLRFHHHVVRGMLGTIDGVPVKTLPGGKYEVKADLKAVRAKLTDYLANYKGRRGGFPSDDRPLDLKGLKLYALVQDDETGAILQGKEIELAGEKE